MSISEQTNVVSTPQILPDRPGPLQTEVWMMLQTRQAQYLVQGRQNKNGKSIVVGLMGFAAQISRIAAGARTGDPYATWWLTKIETALVTAFQTLQSLQTTLMGVLANPHGLHITLAESREPLRIPLRFRHPLAFRGAQLLLTFDTVARAVITARQVDLLSPSASKQQLHTASTVVHRAYASVLGYSFLGITREDLIQGTAKAELAKQRMGILPAIFITNADQSSPPAPALGTSLTTTSGE